MVVEPLVFTECVKQVPLVPDQGAVEQFAATGLYPALDDRVHRGGHLNTTEYDLDAGVGEDGVEQVREFAVSIADQEPCSATGVFEIHDEVPGGLSHPCRGRMCCSAED